MRKLTGDRSESQGNGRRQCREENFEPRTATTEEIESQQGVPWQVTQTKENRAKTKVHVIHTQPYSCAVKEGESS